MQAYIGITDWDWYALLSGLPNLEEVNFWQPSGNQQFKVLRPGEMFLFKLHSPNDYIVGGGFFAYSTILPVSLAWETFGIANGAGSYDQMRTRIEKYRRQIENRLVDYSIGCILIEQPFFFEKANWIPAPYDWNRNIVRGKSYDLMIEPGFSLWNRIQSSMAVQSMPNEVREESPRYGEPILVQPRLGQASFRILVTDAYERKCAITNERTLPALDVAHIKPYSKSGQNVISNGLLLRKDLHALFDKGYITIAPSMEIEVSRKIKEEFENGRDYYQFQGNKIRMPRDINDRPSSVFLEWHNNNEDLGVLL